jgi:hypothetical protein
VDARDSFSPMCGVVYATGLTARLTVQSSNFYSTSDQQRVKANQPFFFIRAVDLT